MVKEVLIFYQRPRTPRSPKVPLAGYRPNNGGDGFQELFEVYKKNLPSFNYRVFQKELTFLGYHFVLPKF